MTLTEVNYWTKRIGLIVIVAFLAFIPLRLVWAIIGAGGDGTRRPAELPYASLGYGTLSATTLISLPLPENVTPEYQLETAAGEFPDVPQVVQVYKLPPKSQTLTTLDEAKLLSGKLKFITEPTRNPNTSIYTWTDQAGRILEYDVSVQNFVLKTEFSKDTFKGKKGALNLTQAKEKSLNFLKGLKLLSQDYVNGHQEAVYLKFGENGEYLLANSQSDSDVVRVDFYRDIQLVQLTDSEKATLEAYSKGDVKLDPKNLPEPVSTSIITEDVNKSNIYIIIRDSNLNKTGAIYEFGYTNWPIDTNKTETYYTKTPAEAWEDVKSGKAALRYLIHEDGEPYIEYEPRAVEQFLIYEITMVYMETKAPQEYLKPVYLIRGEAREPGDTGKPKLEFAFLTDAIKNYE